MRLALIIRLTIGKAYYENTFRVFHHSLINDVMIVTIRTNKSGLFMLLTFFHLPVLDCVSCFVNASNISVVVLLLNAAVRSLALILK